MFAPGAERCNHSHPNCRGGAKVIERSIGYVSIAAAVLLLGLSGCASPGDDASSAHYPPHAAGTSVAGSDLPPCSMIADPNARCIQDDHAAGRDARAYASASAGTAALPFALSAEDREAIGRIAYAEAGNQGEEGIAAVIFCVLNRVNSGLFQGSVQAVIDAPNQFEPATRVGGWRRLPPLDYSQSIQFDTMLNLILAGRLPDLTNGALFFQNAEIVAARAARGSVSPYLVDFGGTPPVAEIGDHRFYDWQAAVNLASARDRRRDEATAAAYETAYAYAGNGAYAGDGAYTGESSYVGDGAENLVAGDAYPLAAAAEAWPGSDDGEAGPAVDAQ
jgi:N-acetylmuramoyl-L-alanine amidase